jgi:excisionase family DNA binding protein
MKAEKLYTLNELCEILQVSQQAARDLLWSHKIAYRKIGGRLRVSQTDLDDYLRRTRIPAHDEVSA